MSSKAVAGKPRPRPRPKSTKTTGTTYVVWLVSLQQVAYLSLSLVSPQEASPPTRSLVRGPSRLISPSSGLFLNL